MPLLLNSSCTANRNPFQTLPALVLSSFLADLQSSLQGRRLPSQTQLPSPSFQHHLLVLHPHPHPHPHPHFPPHFHPHPYAFSLHLLTGHASFNSASLASGNLLPSVPLDASLPTQSNTARLTQHNTSKNKSGSFYIYRTQNSYQHQFDTIATSFNLSETSYGNLACLASAEPRRSVVPALSSRCSFLDLISVVFKGFSFTSGFSLSSANQPTAGFLSFNYQSHT